MFPQSLLRPALLASLLTGVLSYAVPSKDDARRAISHGLFSPIGTDQPQPAGGNVATDAPPVNSFVAGLRPPFPTNSWWAPYAATPGTGTAAGPFPFESNLDGSGVAFGISTSRQFDGTSIQQPTQVDWHAGFVEHNGQFANHKATAFDTQTVTLQYFTGSSTMTSYLVPGSPYMTFQYSGATPLITSPNFNIISFNGQTLNVGTNVTATGTEFTVVSGAGTYLIYALSTITLKVAPLTSSSGLLQATSSYNGVLRIAKINQSSHKTLLDQYVGTYPTAANLDYQFTSTTGSLIFSWATGGGPAANLLMLTWPHHRLVMQSPNFPPTTSLSYLTTKGYMYPALGNQWTMLYTLPAVSWDPPRPVDSSCKATVIQGLQYEIGLLNASNPSVPGDFYYWGGAAAAQARLALIADNMGRPDLVTPVINYLKASFEFWFHSSSSTLPAYETAWGGMVDKAGATNVNIDFGNGYYNDHHFHYGYFLTVAAVIAKFDSNWLAQHKTYINWFARDIVNPSSADPYFPVTRCRDWFAGHSWASGIANGAGSRDQESTGEAVNAYYGALLWASVSGVSADYVHYAQLLLATEQQGAQVYWHLYPSQSPTGRDTPYPEASTRALITMGNVEDWQSGAWLFWGSQRSEIAAIQMLPVTPTNEYLYDTAWVQNVWSYTMSELQDPTIGDEWKSVIIAAYSNANPQVAAAWSANLTTWGSGNTYTNEQFFIATRPNPSGAPICSSTLANPLGNYKLQATSSGKYVVASAANTNLVASGTSASAASVFNGAYIPNSGTLQLASTAQYVTADSSGNYALSATRATASSWEQFVIRPKFGAAAGVYSIKAASNGLWITLGSDGSLLNNGHTEAASAGFKFVSS